MGRARQLKPSFFMDEDVACLTPWARLLFQGLWTLADRKGRLEDRPAFIRVQVFPYDDLEVQGLSLHAMLDELASPRKHRPGGFIQRYVVDGVAYLQIRNFEKHQHPHPKEPASQVPPPPLDKEEPRQAAESNVKPRKAETCRAVPSVPSVPSDKQPPPPPCGGAVSVFEHWRTVMAKNGAVFTPGRQRRVKDRLREGYTTEQLLAAVDGCRASPFHMGENQAKKRYDDLSLICRDGEHVEQFLGYATQARASPEPEGQHLGLPTKGPWEGRERREEKQ